MSSMGSVGHKIATLRSCIMMLSVFATGLGTEKIALGFGSSQDKIVVLAGGFGSCSFSSQPDNMNMWKPLRQVVNQIEFQNLGLPSNRMHIYRACYALTARKVHFDVVEKTTEGEFEFGAVHSGTYGEFLRFISNQMEGFFEPRDVTLIGQSHGGDLMMKLLLDLAPLLDRQWQNSASEADIESPSKRALIKLVTIDPISLDACSPGKFLYNLVRRHAGCTAFPPLSEESLEALVDLTDEWHHFFQDTYKFLHSSDQPLADLSSHLTFPKSIRRGPFGDHKLTETATEVWQSVKQLIERDD